MVKEKEENSRKCLLNAIIYWKQMLQCCLCLVDQPKHFIKVCLSALHVFASLIDANRLEKRRSKLRT